MILRLGLGEREVAPVPGAAGVMLQRRALGPIARSKTAGFTLKRNGLGEGGATVIPARVSHPERHLGGSWRCGIQVDTVGARAWFGDREGRGRNHRVSTSHPCLNRAVRFQAHGF